mmetsp:Transcript_122122/g.182408  ORF Transcript_122122/g.182408 Transcript_122122/m.182408 type:complete len:718 (+) Transcript_122122:85-2238(+)
METEWSTTCLLVILLLLGILLLLVLLLILVVVVRDPSPASREEGGGHEVEEDVEGNDRRPEEEAGHPLVLREVRAPKRRVEAWDLNERNLGDEGADDNDEKDFVFEHPVKHVELVVNLARVDLVEDLHEHEHVEHHGVVLALAAAALVCLGAEVRGTLRHRGTRTLHAVHVERARTPALDAPVVVHVHLAGAHVAVPLAHVAEAEDQCRKHQQLPRAVEHHVADHRLREHRLVTRVRLAREEGSRRVLRRQREGGEGVHDEVDPEHLYCVERGLGEDGSSHTGQRARRDVHRQLELEELADVVVHTAAPLDSGDNGHEVVVHDDDVRGILRNVSPLDAHRKADVGLFERRRVVGTVAGNSNSLRHARRHRGLDAADEDVLVEGRGARQHAQVRPHQVKLVLLDVAVGVGHAVAERLAVQHRTWAVGCRDNATLHGYCLGGVDVVSGHHPDGDASLLALRDRIRNLVTEGVFDSHEAHAHQALFDLGEGDLAVDCARSLPVGGEGALGDAEGAEPEVREVRDRLADLRLDLRGDGSLSAVLAHVLIAERGHNLRSALAVGHGLALRVGHDRRHALAIRRERKHLAARHVVGVLVAHLLVRVLELVAHDKERALRVVAAVREPLAAGGRRLEKSLEESVDHRGRSQLLFDRPSDSGSLLEDLASSPDAHHRHLRRRQRPRLVRADGGSAAHGLTRRQVPHQVLVLQHLLHRERQRDCHR